MSGFDHSGKPRRRDPEGRAVLGALEDAARDRDAFLAAFPPQRLADVTADLLKSKDERVRLRVVELLTRVYGWLGSDRAGDAQPPKIVINIGVPTLAKPPPRPAVAAAPPIDLLPVPPARAVARSAPASSATGSDPAVEASPPAANGAAGDAS